jgi:hypothetical protein
MLLKIPVLHLAPIILHKHVHTLWYLISLYYTKHLYFTQTCAHIMLFSFLFYTKNTVFYTNMGTHYAP